MIASNTAGYIFGGYGTAALKDTQSSEIDIRSFIFSLRKKNKPNYNRFCATENAAVISGHDSWGPAFGSNNGKRLALRFFSQNYTKIMKRANNTLDCVDLLVQLENGYETRGLDNNELHGGNKLLHNIEVYDMSGEVT